MIKQFQEIMLSVPRQNDFVLLEDKKEFVERIGFVFVIDITVIVITIIIIATIKIIMIMFIITNTVCYLYDFYYFIL